MQTKGRAGIVTFHGNPVTLLGPDIKVGDDAPGFRVVDRQFSEVKLADFAGKRVLISAVPSLDTLVCGVQTRRFNEEAENLPDDVVVLTISQDLPFAQLRFCDAENVENTMVLSDHVWREFGMRYGVLIEENALLARSIFVISAQGKVMYREIVPELTDHPNYDEALAAARQ
jgi:thiol peroxidase